MADDTSANQPVDFADLPIQPTGSGVADTQIARMQAELADDEAADASVTAGIADESAGYGVAMRRSDDDGTAPTKTQA